MMRCVLLLGDAGARVGRGLVWSACAGCGDGTPLHVLLINPARPEEGDRLAALTADYGQFRQVTDTLPGDLRGFRMPLTLRRWPQDGEYASVQAMAQDSEDDALLCRALFDRKTASQPLSEGLRADAAAALFAVLTSRADGALAEMLEAAEAALQANEDVRILLCGALHESTGAAGLPALIRLLGKRLAPWKERISLAATLLLPCTGLAEADDAAARAALASPAYADLDAAYVLGLPADQRTPEASEAHLSDWLAACFAWDFFRQETPPAGLFTCRAAPGKFDWRSFGTEADAIRRAFGGFAQASAAFLGVFAPAIRQGLTEPRWLRDRLLKWYAAYFGSVRKMDAAAREALLTQLSALTRLTGGYLAWLAAVLNSLPPALRHADTLARARQAAEDNYRRLTETAGQLTALRRDAEISGLSEEKAVHRHDMADTESERLQQYMQQLEAQQQQLTARQAALDEAVGGAIALRIRQTVHDRQQVEADRLHEQAAEAQRRIDLAAQAAAPEEQHLIAAARTKLRRLERHMAQVDAQAEQAREDTIQAAVPERRSRPPKPDAAPALPQTGLFAADALAFFTGLPEDGPARRQAAQVEDAWSRLLPDEERPLSQLLAALDGRGASESQPLAAFFHEIMKEVGTCRTQQKMG